MDERICARCSSTGEKLVLIKCPICFKLVCEACRYNRGGRLFCTQFCADEFFFGDEE